MAMLLLLSQWTTLNLLKMATHLSWSNAVTANCLLKLILPIGAAGAFWFLKLARIQCIDKRKAAAKAQIVDACVFDCNCAFPIVKETTGQ